MPSPSLAALVAHNVEVIEENLQQIVETVPAAWMPQLKEVYLALAHMKVAANIRLKYSEIESARRRGGPTGTVMAQGGARD